MGPIWLFLLSIYHLHTITHSEVFNKEPTSNSLLPDEGNLNALLPPDVDDDASENIEEIPFVKSGHDQTEVEFRHPISSVNIDYSKNVIVLKFRKEQPKLRFKLDPAEDERRKALDSNFMRFGRTPADFMRFGKRQLEELPRMDGVDSAYFENDPLGRQERSAEGTRDSRGDNFMRFGRSSKDFMRFGRGGPNDFMRFGRVPADFMRFGRGNDFLRFGRTPADFMRFGRSQPNDFMRFGRDPNKDFMRFGRAQRSRLSADRNLIRFGRPDNFMRFGRSRSAPTGQPLNFMRFGKMDQNFMRFGKSADTPEEHNQTKSLLQKSDVRQAAQLLRQTDKEADESNPMDKAIKVLFSKQHQLQQRTQPERQNGDGNGDGDVVGDDDQQTQEKLNLEETMGLDADYGFNAIN